MKTDHHLKVSIYFLILKEGDFRAHKKSGKGDLVSATCVTIKTRATVSGLSNSNNKQQTATDRLGMPSYKNMLQVRFQLSFLSQETPAQELTAYNKIN